MSSLEIDGNFVLIIATGQLELFEITSRIEDSNHYLVKLRKKYNTVMGEAYEEKDDVSVKYDGPGRAVLSLTEMEKGIIFFRMCEVTDYIKYRNKAVKENE